MKISPCFNTQINKIRRRNLPVQKINRLVSIFIVFTLTMSMVACSSSVNEGNSSTTETESTEAFYEGETLEVIVPFSAGGGTDVLVRYLEPFLNDYVEGNPAIQTVNIEGGGSINGANQFVDIRKPDGYTALATSASTTIPFLIGQPEVHYDLRNLQPIVGFPNGVVMYTSPESGVKEGKDLLNPPNELILGATSPTGIDVMTLLAFEVLDITDKVQIIFGYEGAGASRIAFEQGETNLDYQSGTAFKSEVTPLVEEGKAIPLFTYGFTDEEGDLVRDPAYPDIPTVKEVYMDMYGEEPEGEAWEAYKSFTGIVNNLHKALWLHGDAPEEAINALREGTEKAIEDPKFTSEGEEVLGDYTPIVGKELDAAINALVNMDDDILKWVSEFLKEEYGVEDLKR